MKETLITIYLFVLVSCASSIKDRVVTKHYNDKNFPQQFSKALNAYSEQALKNCYQPYLSRFNPQNLEKPIQGKLEYKVVFNHVGKVNMVRLNKKTVLPKSVEACVRKGLWKVNFGKSEFTQFTAYYPLEYTYKKKRLR